MSVCPYVRPPAREIAHAYANMSQLSFQLKLVHCTFILVAGQIKNKNKNKANERRACVGSGGQGGVGDKSYEHLDPDFQIRFKCKAICLEGPKGCRQKPMTQARRSAVS